ncbi:MAG: cellulase family glycosylhydrolase [Gaiellaceae bacterium]
MRLRVSRRSFSVVGAGICVCAVALASGTASLASAGGRQHTAHRAQQLRTYATRGTLPLRTSVLDPFTFTGSDQERAFQMASSAGASYMRLVVPWSHIAPADPSPDFVATDPTSPEYGWRWLDRTVEVAEDAGLTPILDIGEPPSWALAKHGKPPKAGAPKTAALGDFATALALRYDGTNGEPAVHVFQVWNEPNLSLDLYPVNAAITYRNMVNAVADAVHAVRESNIVVAGGLDPFENLAKRFVTQAPLAFMRTFLCLSKGSHPHSTCNTKVHFDAWSHHPYTFGGPFGKAKRADDVSLGDLPKMRALLKAGARLHHIVSSHPVQFWVTEFGWDTKPPRRHAAPVALEARWTSEALYQMWRSGVSLATWFLLQDRPSPSPYQSGLFFHSKSLKQARAKPMRTAFRFPFAAYLGKGTVRIWGRDATSKKTLVTIQQRHGVHGAWRAVARIRTNRWGIFVAPLKLKAASGDWLRATAPGSGNSLAFSLAVPKNQRYGPWGN